MCNSSLLTPRPDNPMINHTSPYPRACRMGVSRTASCHIPRISTHTDTPNSIAGISPTQIASLQKQQVEVLNDVVRYVGVWAGAKQWRKCASVGFLSGEIVWMVSR